MFEPLYAAPKCMQYAIEAAAFTAETLADADAAWYAENPSLEFSGDNTPREDIGASGGWAPSTPVGMSANGSVGIRFYGAGAALPAWADLLQICRFKKATNVFTLTNDPAEWLSATVKSWIGSTRYRLVRGCMADPELVWTANKNLIITPRLMGAAVEEADGTVPTGVTITGSTPPIWGGTANCTINGLTGLGISTATLRLNNGTHMRESPNHGEGELGKGWAGGWHGPSQPTFEIDPEATAKTNVDWMALQQAGTLFDATLVIGSANGNKLTCLIEGLQVSAPPGIGDRNKKVIDNVMMQVNGGITLTFALSV
jgi:hypothetical protein